MAIDLCNKLIDNDLTKEELLDRVVIAKTTFEDVFDICDTLAKSFGLSSNLEAFIQLSQSKARLDESVKLIDKETNEIYGVLIFCEYPISIGSPIQMISKELNEYFSQYKQINGHSFIIDERLRGCGFDKKMLYYNLEFLSKNFDLIWCGVENGLKTHLYWQRLGFVEVFRIPEAVFYILPLSKKLITEYLL